MPSGFVAFTYIASASAGWQPIDSPHAGVHLKVKSPSWSAHKSKSSAAKSDKHAHKAAPPSSGDDKHTALTHKPASTLAAGAAAGSTAADRKGKAKFIGNKAKARTVAALDQDSLAEHQRQQDEQRAALPISHSRVRMKVSGKAFSAFYTPLTAAPAFLLCYKPLLFFLFCDLPGN